MIIYVSSELKKIKSELINRGYKVMENSKLSDIIICDLKNEGIFSQNIVSNSRSEGTLIIHAGSKSIEEIENIINNRIYSSLF